MRVPIEPKLGKILEKQSRDDMDPEMVGDVHSSSGTLPVLNAGKQSNMISSNEIGVSNDFPDAKGINPKYSFDAPLREGSDTSISVFPRARGVISNRERAVFQSEFSRA